ncbi:MAG: hypothetical protein K2I64_03405 [Muribaculaceae bacterium]|nr:hypothetical protein [Muribaculaceae bacterium]
MASNRNEHLRYRYGICLNDSCEKCKSKEVQQIPARKDLVCESCGKPLRECPPPKSFGQKYGKLIGIGVAAVVIIGGIATYFLLPSKNGGSIETLVVDSIAIDTVATPIVVETPKVDSISEVANDSLEAKAYADSVKLAKADSILLAAENAKEEAKAYADSIKLAKADSILLAAENAKEEAKTQPAAVQPKPSTATMSSSSTHKLSYGTWSGGMKNGQPHGNGTMTYSTSRSIDSRDPKGRVAQPGEYIVGEWDNGHLVQGRWFKNDGSKEAVIIGKAG